MDEGSPEAQSENRTQDSPTRPPGLAPDSPPVCKIQAPPWTRVLRQRGREEYEVEKRSRKGHRTLGKSKTQCGGDAWHCPGPPAEPGGRQVASCALDRLPFQSCLGSPAQVGEARPGSAARCCFCFWPPQRWNVFFMYFLTQG